MGRLSDAISNSSYKPPRTSGRLSGIISSTSAIEQKNKYYKQVATVNNYNAAIEAAKQAEEEAAKAKENLSFWENIAGIPKQIYKAGKETLAATGDIALRLSPIESARNIASGISSSAKGESFQKGFAESQARKTMFEKISGEELTNEDGSINWDAGRKFIGRAMEAPTYAYAGAVRGAALVGKGLLSRIAARTAMTVPEAGVNTALQQFEQGNMQGVGTNLLANALLMSGISNVAGEVGFSKVIARKTIDDIEKEIGGLTLSERADVIDAIRQGIKPEEIIENVKKVKSNEFTPDDVASRLNKQFSGSDEVSLKDISKKEFDESISTDGGGNGYRASEKADLYEKIIKPKIDALPEPKDGEVIVYRSGMIGDGGYVNTDPKSVFAYPVDENFSVKIVKESDLEKTGVKARDDAGYRIVSGKKPVQISPAKKAETESPILKEINKNIETAGKLDETLPTTSFKNQFSKASKEIGKDPAKAYNRALDISDEGDEMTKSALQLMLIRNAIAKNDDKALAELGMAAAKTGRKAGQTSVMFRALYNQDPMSRVLMDFVRAKLANVESRFPKVLKKSIEEGSDIVSRTAKSIKKKSQVSFKDAQSIIDKFIC